MQVDVRLSIILRRGRFTHKTLDLPDGATIGDLLDSLDLTAPEVAITSVNGQHVQADYRMREGDEVCLYPPTAGG